MARFAYLGTPALAIPPLEALLGAGHEVALVVSRPDRRRGRGGAVDPSPVKAAALERGLPYSENVADVSAADVDLAVVVAFGRIIPVAVLEQVPMVNLHFSLLPRWRGAAPVERAILAGDAATGVCIMTVEEGLDTGAVYAREEVAIGPSEHLEPLRARLVERGSALLVEVLAAGAAGLPTPQPQQGEPSYAEKIRPDELEMHWDRPAVDLARLVRLDRAWTTFKGRRLRVLEAEVGEQAGSDDGRPPGALHGTEVTTGAGMLRLVTVQPEGKAPMRVDDWLHGVRSEEGVTLG